MFLYPPPFLWCTLNATLDVITEIRICFSSLRLLLLHDLYSNRIESHSFLPGEAALRGLRRAARAPSDEDLRHGLTEDNQPVAVCSVHGALWLACCFSHYCWWQLLVSLGRTHDQQEPRLILCVWRWIWSGPDAAPPGGLLSLRAVITADCASQRLALIGLSLSVHWGKEELAFVRLPWRRGHLMRASALWLMTSLSPSDILQMDNLLHHSQFCTTVHKHKGHTSAERPEGTACSFHLRSIKTSGRCYLC